MDGCAAQLDRRDGIKGADGRLEGLEVAVLVGEDTEATRVYAKADAGVHVLLGGLEPGIPLSLFDNRVSEGGA